MISTDPIERSNAWLPAESTYCKVQDLLVVKTRYPDPSLSGSNTPSKKKRLCSCLTVRFEVDSNDEIIPEIATGRVSLTQEEKTRMWWHGGDDIKRRAKREAIKIRRASEGGGDEKYFSTYISNFRRALDECITKSGRFEALPMVSGGPGRGLEQMIFSELSQWRYRFVRTLINAQKQLPATLPHDQKAHLLCATSKLLSRPSMRLARFMAIGDARVAARL
jgi:hypothetical protein